jgi:uncharacterized protein
MHVVLAGGTGFIGQGLAKVCVQSGAHVTVLSRRGMPSRDGVKSLVWDGRTQGEWGKALHDATCVINLSGRGIFDARWTPAFLDECRRSRVESTRACVEAIMARPSGAPDIALVNASAVGFYGETGDRVVDENASLGRGTLAEMCRDWEAEALKAAPAARVVCARLGIVLGKSGGALAQMLPPFRAFVGGPLGSGKQYFPWVHEADAVQALMFLARSAHVAGPVNVCAPNPVMMSEFADELGKAIGRPSWFKTPSFALKLALGERATALLASQRIVPKRLRDEQFAFLYPTLPEALRALLQ